MVSTSLPQLCSRSSGVLLHLSSLDGPHGIGDLGDEAHAFVDFLSAAGQRYWQMLPVGPAGYGDSPYSALSAFAGNPLFVDLERVGVSDAPPVANTGAVDYGPVTKARTARLRAAFARLDSPARKRLDAYCERERAWLDDWALYDAIKRAYGGRAWVDWEEGVRRRDAAALAAARSDLAADIAFAQACQWAFDEQWSALRAHAHDRGIALVGDMPIFVAHDSADVWQHRELFDLDADGRPRNVAGVPPDYFSATGQRWGNPLYRWKRIAKTGYAWWVERFKAALARFDVVRIDHFIGFVRYWQIDAREPTAVNGRWLRGPGKPLFDAVRREVGGLPLIAEDLGAITPRVTKLRRAIGAPGIRLVQFAFGTDPQAPSFLPHNHHRRSVVYTGTHDNDTSLGWFSDPGDIPTSSRTRAEADAERHAVLRYMGREDVAVDPAWELMRLAMGSVADTCIVPMQDVLGLGTEARMNRPGTTSGNWRWRMKEPPGPALASRLRHLTETYGR